MAFPDDRDKDLQWKSQETLGRAEDLLEWLGDNNNKRREQGLGVIPASDEFRLLQLRRRAENLYRASKVPVAAAVIGPSQVGKSLFLGRVLQPQSKEYSPLGRDERHGPPAYQQKLSFDLDLNPRLGSKEATAIVTRFTTKDRFDETVPQEFPVLVRALSRAEWLRVLARGYRSEYQLPGDWAWPESALEQTLSDVAKDWGAREVDRQWRMDLIDVYSYLKRLDGPRYSADESTFNSLLSRYPLTHDGYVEVASRICWNEWHGMTDFFNRVERFLNRLRQNGRDGLLVHWAAVRFLLDCQRQSHWEVKSSQCFEEVQLNDLVDETVDGWYVLDYKPGQGPPKEDIAVIQAAMREMVIPVIPERLNEEWRKVLENIDFLDVPGIRAEGKGQEQITEKDVADKDKSLDLRAAMNIVIRGKVFYLLDRYIEEMQAQTLLLLIRGFNVEVRGLIRGYVDKWGISRYGKAWPESVRDVPPPLFIGMTGIDDEFEKEPPKAALYDGRLNEIADATLKYVMKNFGGKGKRFKNVFPVRYPGTWDADEADRQRDSDGPQKWEDAGREFLKSQLVQQYVENAEEKWKAAMRDGDGGASLLAPAIRETTKSRQKQNQLERDLGETSDEILRIAENWVVDPNANLDRDNRVALGEQVIGWLMAEPRFVYTRVHGLKEALCLQQSDVYCLADITEFRALTPSPTDDIEERFREEFQILSHDWCSEKAPSRWNEYVSSQDNAGDWMDGETFGKLSRYLADFLRSEAIFAELQTQLLRIVRLQLPDEAAERRARRKYILLILNDYLLNLGKDACGNKIDSDMAEFGLMAPFISRWKARLPAVLASGAGDNVGIPHGNDELIELLRKFKET